VEASLKIRSIWAGDGPERIYPKSFPPAKEADRIVAPLKNAAFVKVVGTTAGVCDAAGGGTGAGAGTAGGGARVEIVGLLVGWATCPPVIVLAALDSKLENWSLYCCACTELGCNPDFLSPKAIWGKISYK
jgi:hypothetical protein